LKCKNGVIFYRFHLLYIFAEQPFAIFRNIFGKNREEIRIVPMGYNFPEGAGDLRYWAAKNILLVKRNFFL